MRRVVFGLCLLLLTSCGSGTPPSGPAPVATGPPPAGTCECDDLAERVEALERSCVRWREGDR